MAAPSRKTYPCYSCQRSGHVVQVFLDGKDEQGRTKYLNQDGTRHVHYQPQQQQTKEEDEGSFEVVSSQELQQPQQELQQQGSTTIVTEPTSMKIINAKLDRIIALLESQQQQK